MKMKTNALLVTLASVPAMSFGALTVDIIEDGTDVIFLISGSVNVSGLTPLGTISEGTVAQLNGSAASSILLRGSGATPPVFSGATPTINGFSTGVVGLKALLGGPLPTVMIASNGIVSVSADLIGAPPTTSSSGLLFNESFASLGITDGVISSTSWSTGSGTESITFRTGSAVVFVPEPSSSLLLGLSAIGLCSRRRRSR